MFVSDADFMEKTQFFPWQNLKSSWSRNSPSCFRFSGLCCCFYLSQGNGRKKEAGQWSHRRLCREGQLVDLDRLGQSRGPPPPHPLPAGPFPPPGAGGGGSRRRGRCAQPSTEVGSGEDLACPLILGYRRLGLGNTGFFLKQ